MRTGNPSDGMYLILILIPVILSILTGDLLRKRIISHPYFENSRIRNSSRVAGSLAEILIIATGIVTGFLLVCLV